MCEGSLTRQILGCAMVALVLMGRVLFAALFLVSAFGHFARTAAMTGYAQSRGVPAPRTAVLLGGVLLLTGRPVGPARRVAGPRCATACRIPGADGSTYARILEGVRRAGQADGADPVLQGSCSRGCGADAAWAVRTRRRRPGSCSGRPAVRSLTGCASSATYSDVS